jgi:hypothetical protein
LVLPDLALSFSPGDREVTTAEAKVWLISKRARDGEIAVQQELRLDAVLPVAHLHRLGLWLVERFIVHLGQLK